MNKIIVLLAAASLIASPASAHQRDRKVDAGDVVAALIIGGIVGAIVADKDDNRYPRSDTYGDNGYHYRRGNGDLQRHRTCFNEQIIEYRNGRRFIYNEYRCH